MYAFVGDVLGYYLDNQARESRLATATQRKNVIALARMLGFRLEGARAATAKVSFSIGAPSPAPFALPVGTLVRTQEVTDPVRFELTEPVVFPPGSTTAAGVVEHSETHSELFDARGLVGTDLPLARQPYLDRSARVVASGVEYTEVETLLGSGPTDRHFVVLVDQNDRATLRFGSGLNGLPPTGTIAVTYKTGGGAEGNVDGGRLVLVEGSFSDAFGRPVKVLCTNPAPASGGVDRQSLELAKKLAPESLRALTRTVAREDFEIHARKIPGVARALMLTSNEDPTIAENAGILFVVPQGGGLPSPALKGLVHTQVTVTYPCTLTFEVDVQDPVYRPVDVEARVFLREGARPEIVRDRIRARLAAMFRLTEPDGTPNPHIDFGFNLRNAEGKPAGEVAWSDVFDTVRDTEGVRKLGDGSPLDLKLNGLPTDVKLAVRELPVLRTVTILSGDTGGIL